MLLLTRGFSPRRTIATSQTLYMRFHLFFPYKDFNYAVRPTHFPFIDNLPVSIGGGAIDTLRLVQAP